MADVVLAAAAAVAGEHCRPSVAWTADAAFAVAAVVDVPFVIVALLVTVAVVVVAYALAVVAGVLVAAVVAPPIHYCRQ